MSTVQSTTPETSPGRAGSTPRPGPVLLLAGVGPVVIGYVGVAALLALVTATARGATLSTVGVLRAAGPAWLAAYHVPVRIDGHELGMLPLVPTFLVVAVIARSARNAADRLDWYTPRAAIGIAAAIGCVHAVCAVLVASISGAALPVVAFFGVGVVAAFGALLGGARDCLVPAALARADDAPRTGLRAGVLGTVCLGAVGTLVFAVGLLANWSTAVALFRFAAPGLGSGLGMFLLCVAYLPNVLVGTVSFAAGPGFTIGQVAIAQWRFAAGPLPALPILAPVPAVEADWWIFLMLPPLLAGVLAGLLCRRLSGVGARLRAVGVAALLTGLSWLVLAALAGGALAGGPFDPVLVPAGSLAAAAALFVAIPGGIIVLTAGREMYVADIDTDIDTDIDAEFDDTDLDDADFDDAEPDIDDGMAPADEPVNDSDPEPADDQGLDADSESDLDTA